tara:strand:+ start:1139 stop:1366 length:228 start_codon:yes stop_codon:yes gene_type:complete
MAIKNIKKKPIDRTIEIDLTGPDGNAYVLLGKARSLAKQLGLPNQEIEDDMMSGDYEHLLEVFDKHFGSFVTLWR